MTCILVLFFITIFASVFTKQTKVMLFIGTVTKWAHYGGRASSSGKKWILNTNNIFNLQAKDTTKSKFFYVDNLFDSRRGAKLVNIEEATSVVTTAFDATYNSKYITLAVYPDHDTSQSTVNRVIPVDSITLGSPYTTYDVAPSWITYSEGGKDVKVLVNDHIQDIIDLADTGTTTTSTTLS